MMPLNSCWWWGGEGWAPLHRRWQQVGLTLLVGDLYFNPGQTDVWNSSPFHNPSSVPAFILKISIFESVFLVCSQISISGPHEFVNGNLWTDENLAVLTYESDNSFMFYFNSHWYTTNIMTSTYLSFPATDWGQYLKLQSKGDEDALECLLKYCLQ